VLASSYLSYTMAGSVMDLHSCFILMNFRVMFPPPLTFFVLINKYVNRSLFEVGAEGTMSEEPVRTSYELRIPSGVAGISQYISVSFSSLNQYCTGADT